MKMKIKTELLQKMVSKAIQGAGNNKMIPLTSLIGIQVKNKNLILITTDGSNQLKINNEIELDPTYGPTDSQEFYTIVNAETFSKLIGKTTKEFIELENKENYLEVVGNGTYKLEIAINEEGEMVKFPDIKDIEGDELAVNLRNLQEAIKITRASVAKTMELPYLTGYYIDNYMLTTDKKLVCKYEGSLINQPILISSEMAELLLLVEGDDILELIKKDNDLIFYNANYTIAGKELADRLSYPVTPIDNLIKLDYKASVKINKFDLLNILDRMSLFVNEYDANGVYLKFDPNGLLVRSKKSNAEECIVFPATYEIPVFECLIDIEMLKAQLETISSEFVEIYYGQGTSIKLVDNNVIHVISLLERAN